MAAEKHKKKVNRAQTAKVVVIALQQQMKCIKELHIFYRRRKLNQTTNRNIKKKRL